MSHTTAIAPSKQTTTRTALSEHLAQLEASLEETRGRVLSALDEELASIRKWMESLENMDSNLTIYRPESAAGAKKDKAAKTSKPDNIVQLHPQDFAGEPQEPTIQEPPLDPALEKATMDELNAALAAVFEHMGH